MIGVDEVYRVGGIQGIGALAYGTTSASGRSLKIGMPILFDYLICLGLRFRKCDRLSKHFLFVRWPRQGHPTWETEQDDH